MHQSTRTLTLLAALGSGLNGGVFFAFSTFVMQALRRLPERQGLTAMQAVNEAAPTPVFMTALFGTAVLCLVVGVGALRSGDDPRRTYAVVGAALFLACIVLTAVCHVPHNDALARVDPDSATAGAAWLRYAGGWTAWNHLRTITCLGAAASFTFAWRAS